MVAGEDTGDLLLAPAGSGVAHRDDAVFHGCGNAPAVVRPVRSAGLWLERPGVAPIPFERGMQRRQPLPREANLSRRSRHIPFVLMLEKVHPLEPLPRGEGEVVAVGVEEGVRLGLHTLERVSC